MSYRTHPDRILDNIDRERSRDVGEPGMQIVRQATGRELGTEVPDPTATQQERLTRIFKLIEASYVKAAQSVELRQIAARFRGIGDIHHHHARGDVTISVHYLDGDRDDTVAMAPFEVRPEAVEEAKEATGTSRPDVNALRVLREHLRECVMAAYTKLEPRLRDSIRDRADLGHVSVQITIDVRPAR
ncbi:MAG: hypothetical protein HY704_03730 [Gemmatimonadetes bacterium]|nr:hypothetical protein [Gemmatimonadota bacterium]